MRARTDSPSSRNDDADPDVNRSSTPRRATWTDSNGTPVEYDLKREGADAVAPGGRRHAPMVGNETISGGHGTDLDHVRAVGHDWPPNSPCDSREGSSSVGDDMGFALPSPALQEVGHGASDGSKGNIRGGDGQREARAQSRDIEQRLQSVMEDLGVPVRESMESAESRSRSLPRRSKPPAMNGVEQNRPKSEKRERIELGGDGPLRDKQFLCDDGVGAAEGEVRSTFLHVYVLVWKLRYWLCDVEIRPSVRDTAVELSVWCSSRCDGVWAGLIDSWLDTQQGDRDISMILGMANSRS